MSVAEGEQLLDLTFLRIDITEWDKKTRMLVLENFGDWIKKTQTMDDSDGSIKNQIFRDKCIREAGNIQAGDELCDYCQDLNTAPYLVQNANSICSAHSALSRRSLSEFLDMGVVELTTLRNQIEIYANSVSIKRRRNQ